MMIIFLSVLFIILYIMNSTVAIPQTADALRLFLFVVLPSVYPLCVISDWLVRTESFTKIGAKFAMILRPLFGISGMGILAVLTGWVGSYPTGAKTTAMLYKNRQITYQDALSLTAFTNNAGPLFVIGVIGTSMLKSTALGILLWICHILSAFVTGLLFRNKQHRNTMDAVKWRTSATKINPFQALSLSIADTAKAMIPVAGTVVFFAALCAALEISPNGVGQALASCCRFLLEMTSGCHAITQASFHDLNPQMALMVRCALYAGAIAWGGMSVHIQIIYILSKEGLPCKQYILGKITQTVIAVIITTLAVFMYQRI